MVELALPALDDDQRAVHPARGPRLRRGGRRRGRQPATEIAGVAHAERRGSLLQRPGDLTDAVLRLGDAAAQHPGLVVERDDAAMQALEGPPDEEPDGHAGEESQQRHDRGDDRHEPVARAAAGRFGSEAWPR